MQIGYGLNQGRGGHSHLRRLHEWCLFKTVLTEQVLNLVLTGQEKQSPSLILNISMWTLSPNKEDKAASLVNQ